MEFKETPAQGEMFVCDITAWPVKDDLASMDFPMFSLAKQMDTKTRQYKVGAKTVRIIPSGVGAATVFDKDLLLYICSQMMVAINEDKPVSRTVQITSIDFLTGTQRGDGWASYERILDLLRRLRGTTIETNVATGDVLQTKGFSMIDNYEVLSEKKRSSKTVDKHTGETKHSEVTRIFSFTVTISEWLFNSLKAKAVLTLDRHYFSLSSSVDRRLYEIVRKHCGDKTHFKINMDLLSEKLFGEKKERFKMRDILREIIANDELPGYRIALDTHVAPDMVVFFTKDMTRLYREIFSKDLNMFQWFQTLESAENKDKWQSATARAKETARHLALQKKSEKADKKSG
jgi:plasmid replication initiation protein